MSRTSLTRWALATIGLVAILGIELATGRHACALAALVVMLVLVATFGGSPSRDRSARTSADDRPMPPSEP